VHYNEHLRSRTLQRTNKFEESLIQIARAWEANKSMLRLHFNSQEEFFDEIIEKSYNKSIDNRMTSSPH
jgi:hypothetical protein